MRARTDNTKRPVAYLAAVILALLFFAQPAFCWFNEGWEFRRKITLNTAASGADIGENLNDVPVLIRLSAGNFDFSVAKADGSDLRFVKSDDKTVLKHSFELYDTVDQMALVWVRVDRLAGNSDQDFIWVYYGNEEAKGTQDPAGVYDANQAAVFHFAGTEGLPRDSTAFANNAEAFVGAQGLPSIIGNGVSFSGADKMALAASPSLEFPEGFTFSAWLRPSVEGQEATLLRVADEKNEVRVGLSGTSPYFRMTLEDGQVLETEKAYEMAPGSWHHLAVTASPRGRISVFVDGRETGIDAPAALPRISAPIVIGGAEEEGSGYMGELDEVQFSKIARSTVWIDAARKSQEPQGVLVSMGDEEVNDTGGLPTFYLATVMRNITLDGWVIIGILVLFAVLSWIIFLTKAFSAWVTVRDNKAFLEAFGAQEDVLALEGKTVEFASSNLVPIYSAAVKELKAKYADCGLEKKDGKGLPTGVMESVKAAMERAYLVQVQKLNAGVVVLTMAISGGPFLGLLGTVWGVMNTFAAMAEAGDANIMAIAPGVASALSTTVFGLIVAIPALFGYNYLAGKIRNISAEIALFTDELPLKISRQMDKGDPA